MKNYKRWIIAIVLFPLIFVFMTFGAAHIKSIANYFLTKDVIDQGGGASQTTNFKLVDAIGQPGGVGAATSTNYKESSGFFTGGGLTPMLSVSPTTLDFGTAETNKTFQISNTGSGTLTWTVTESPDKPWITSVSPASGSGDTTVTVTVDRSLLVGNSDTGNLSVTSNGGNATVTVLIQAAPTGVPIYPSASTTQTIGAEFWVDIIVGDNVNPVSDLFGVSFDLNFTNTTYVDVVTPHSNNVVTGTFIGSDVVFVQTVDEAAGKVSIGISRKAGQGGVSGFGTVARIKFVSNAGTPEGTSILFSLSSVSANDPVGTTIALTPGTLTVTLSGGLIVWPGDTNNDGVVNQVDVLPIGLSWGLTGPPRPGASIAWIGQPATPWTPENATYTDANGDGTVDQADVLPIGLNWGKTHTLMSAPDDVATGEKLKKPNASTLQINLTGDTRPNGVCRVEFVAENVTNLFGISFEMVYSPTTYIDSIRVENGSWLGNDIIFYPNVDMSSGKVSFGISRKAGQGGISGTGVIATTTRMKMKDIPPVLTELTLQNVVANDHLGNPITFDAVNHTITAVEENIVEAIPQSFYLHQNYPNPFNPETTIEYSLPQPAEVILTIYDMKGHEVRQLVQERKSAGFHSVQWDARDNIGQITASGVYFYRIKVKAHDSILQYFVDVKKMILMK